MRPTKRTRKRTCWRLSEILPFSQYRLALSEFDAPPSDRVQFAMDQALIAACERVARILRSDLIGRAGRLRTEDGGEFLSSVLSLPVLRPSASLSGARRLSGCGRACLALVRVFLVPVPVRWPGAGLTAMLLRFPDIAESIPAANCVAVSPQQSARYSPCACHVPWVLVLGMIFPLRKGCQLTVVSCQFSAVVFSTDPRTNDTLLSTSLNLLSRAFPMTDRQTEPVFELLGGDVDLLALPGRVRGTRRPRAWRSRPVRPRRHGCGRWLGSWCCSDLAGAILAKDVPHGAVVALDQTPAAALFGSCRLFVRAVLERLSVLGRIF